jgi:hypothetical protein
MYLLNTRTFGIFVTRNFRNQLEPKIIIKYHIYNFKILIKNFGYAC